MLWPTWCEGVTHLKRPRCWERLKAGEGDDRGWHGWMASLTQWTWVWVNSGSWWWAGRPGMRYIYVCMYIWWSYTLICMHNCSILSNSCNPKDCSPPGSFVHGLSQARIPEWVVISSSRGSSWPSNQTCMSYIFCIGKQILYHWATWEVPHINITCDIMYNICHNSWCQCDFMRQIILYQFFYKGIKCCK